MSSPSAREGGAGPRLPPEVGGLSDVGAVWHHGPGSQSDVDLAERAAQDGLVAAQDARDARESLLCAPDTAPRSRTPRPHVPARRPRRRHELLDVSGTLNSAAAAIVDDTFTKCFKSNAPDPWNWNAYLFPLWVVGCVVRYGILFPVRCVAVTIRAPRRAARPPCRAATRVLRALTPHSRLAACSRWSQASWSSS